MFYIFCHGDGYVNEKEDERYMMDDFGNLQNVNFSAYDGELQNVDPLSFEDEKAAWRNWCNLPYNAPKRNH